MIVTNLVFSLCFFQVLSLVAAGTNTTENETTKQPVVAPVTIATKYETSKQPVVAPVTIATKYETSTQPAVVPVTIATKNQTSKQPVVAPVTNTTKNETSGPSIVTKLSQGAKTAATAAVEGVKKVTSALGLDNDSVCVEPRLECPNENITFWYYSRPDLRSPVKISVSDPRSFELIKKNDQPWKLIIHGYTKSKDEIPNPQLIEAYQKQGKGYNILSIDYAPIARKSCYIQAVSNVPLVSKCTAQILDELVNRGYAKLDKVHVIGFSLGGQISGRIHEYLSRGRPSRVTALDPASPLFDGKVNEKVNKSAADFVDVIHTNTVAFGMKEPTGHVDFYINNGAVQPGCLNTKNNESLTTCSHNRSPIIYAESINSDKGFWGVPCTNRLKFYSGKCDTTEDKLVIMGEYTPFKARGIYYLQTSDRAPYALGKMSAAYIDL